jgi:2-polyprenyl-3-methyl-5-hydroxy-6-metoxy-1,4-benzoquinol methylase
MKKFDRFLQKYRIWKASPYILPGRSVLDIGCHDGTLFRELGERISHGVGIDPLEPSSWVDDRFLRIVGSFPDDVPELGEFDVITMLAVLEHFPDDKIETLPCHIARFLKPGGLLVITIPSPRVNDILALLKWMRVIEGMSLEEHHGLTVDTVLTVFSQYFELKVRKSFQFGLNNLLVYQKRDIHTY